MNAEAIQEAGLSPCSKSTMAPSEKDINVCSLTLIADNMNHIEEKTTLLILVLIASILFVPVTVSAQENNAPQVTLVNGNIEVNAGETTTVTNTYKFRVSSVGSGDQRLTAITGSIWKFPDRSISEISASVNGNSVSPRVTEQDRHYEISLPLQEVSAGEVITVTVGYEVSGPAGAVQAPMFVPDYATEGRDSVIDFLVTVPEGESLQGTMFPAPDTTSGNQITAETLHVPGMVKLNYGTGGGLDLNTVLSAVGVVFIIAVIGGWALIQRRRAAGIGGDAVVD